MTLPEEDVSLPDGTYNRASRDAEIIERRRFKRVSVLRPVKYVSKQFGETNSLMLDLSCGGAYIESPVVAEGCQIEIEFNLMDGHTVRTTAIVRYVILGAGMGVEFQSISDEDTAQISAFVGGFRVPATARVADDLK